MNGMNAQTGAAIAGVDHLRQSIADILGTPRGTRVARRDYGSDLPELLDQPANDVGRLRIFAATALALLRQEPRLRLTRVALSAADRPGAFRLTVEGKRTDTARRPAALSYTLPLRALSALA